MSSYLLAQAGLGSRSGSGVTLAPGTVACVLLVSALLLAASAEARTRFDRGKLEVTADELRRRHDHLQKIGVDLEALSSRARETEEKLDERRDAMVEARREVKTLEVLLNKEHARAKLEEGRRQQRILDGLAARKHRGRLQ